jgi:hypothetical protein
LQFPAPLSICGAPRISHWVSKNNHEGAKKQSVEDNLFVHQETPDELLWLLPLTRDLRPAGEPKLVTNQRYPIIVGLAWTANSR